MNKFVSSLCSERNCASLALAKFTPLSFAACIGSMGMLPEIHFQKAGKGVENMQLLPKYVLSKLPALYTQENVQDPIAVCKFFAVFMNWTWYAIEFDGKDLFFGYVAGDFPELGYFSLSELTSLKGPMGLSIERDLYFKPQALSKIRKIHEGEV